MSLSLRRYPERAVTRWAALGAWAWLGVVLLVCLLPQQGLERHPFRACLLCAPEATLGDLILNVGLYVPLGLAVRLHSGSTRLALAVGFGLCCAVETAQIFIPGRFPTIDDILANTLGAGLGSLLALRPKVWAVPDSVIGLRLALAWAVCSTLSVGLMGALLTTSTPEGPLYAQWTPHLEGSEPYSGRVLEASVGGVRLPNGRVEGEELERRLRSALREGSPVELTFTLGAAPEYMKAVFRIVEEAEGGRWNAVLEVAVMRDALVFWRRYRADDVRLSRPDLRVSGAAAGVVGDTLRVVVRSDADGRWLLSRGSSPARALPVRTARGWGFLYFPDHGPIGLPRLGDLAWLAILFLPIGWWASSPGAALALAAVPVGAMWGAPRFWPFLESPAPDLAVAVLALAVGYSVRRALAPRHPSETA